MPDQISCKTSFKGKQLIMLLPVLALAVYASVAAITPLQNARPTHLLMFFAFFGMWLAYSFIFGFGFRAMLIWTSLFFIKPFQMTFYGALGIMLLGFIISYYDARQSSMKIPYLFWLVMLFIAALQGFIRARDHLFASQYFFATAIVPAICLVYFANAKTKAGDFEAWAKAIVSVAAVLGFIGLIMAILNPSARMGSLWITAMTINGFYTISFFFALGLGLKSTSCISKSLWYMAALFIFLGILFTYTRIALLAVVFGLGIMVWRIKRFRLAGMMALMLIPLVIPGAMLTRLSYGLTKDGSMFIRFVAWWFSYQQIIKYPWFGTGISVWKEWYWHVVPLKNLYAEHSHNLPIKIWLEIGLIGLIPYFYIIFAIILRYYKLCVKHSKDHFDFLVLLGVLSLLFSCITDIFVQQYSISLVFWCALAFMHIRVYKLQKPLEGEKQ